MRTSHRGQGSQRHGDRFPFGYRGDWPDSSYRRAVYARALQKLERLAYAPDSEIRLVPNRLEAKALLAVMAEGAA